MFQRLGRLPLVVHARYPRFDGRRRRGALNGRSLENLSIYVDEHQVSIGCEFDKIAFTLLIVAYLVFSIDSNKYKKGFKKKKIVDLQKNRGSTINLDKHS